jgi:hypothetical protein
MLSHLLSRKNKQKATNTQKNKKQTKINKRVRHKMGEIPKKKLCYTLSDYPNSFQKSWAEIPVKIKRDHFPIF